MSATELKSETNPCLVCGADEWVSIREGGDLCRPKYTKRFRLARCLCCGHVMQSPTPDDTELNAAYSVAGDYLPYRPAWKELGWPAWKILRLWTTLRRVAWLNRYGTGHYLLEVGCGAGDFLVAAHRAGWKVKAVEHNRSLGDTIRGAFDFDVRIGELVWGLWAEKEFDAVALWNVLEHLRDPLRDLRIAVSYLRPGGVVLLNIPSRQAAEHGQWFGQYWALLDLPRHISFFDKGTLARLCSRAGLELVVYRTPFIQSAWCYYMSCWRWANRDEKASLRWPRFLALAAAVTLALPYIAVQSWSHRGLEAFAVAVKP